MREYRLGDTWSNDFDYDGMIQMGLDTSITWSISKLNKLADSFTDVNFHILSKNLYYAIEELENNNQEEAKEYLDLFHKDLQEHIEEEYLETIYLAIKISFEDLKKLFIKNDIILNENNTIVIEDIEYEPIITYEKDNKGNVEEIVLTWFNLDEEVLLYCTINLKTKEIELSSDILEIEDSSIISIESFKKGGALDRGKRPSPKESATIYKAGTRKEGQDGNIYEVVIAKNGVKRWSKVSDKRESFELETEEEIEEENTESSIQYNITDLLPLCPLFDDFNFIEYYVSGVNTNDYNLTISLIKQKFKIKGRKISTYGGMKVVMIEGFNPFFKILIKKDLRKSEIFEISDKLEDFLKPYYNKKDDERNFSNFITLLTLNIWKSLHPLGIIQKNDPQRPIYQQKLYLNVVGAYDYFLGDTLDVGKDKIFGNENDGYWHSTPEKLLEYSNYKPEIEEEQEPEKERDGFNDWIFDLESEKIVYSFKGVTWRLGVHKNKRFIFLSSDQTDSFIYIKFNKDENTTSLTFQKSIDSEIIPIKTLKNANFDSFEELLLQIMRTLHNASVIVRFDEGGEIDEKFGNFEMVKNQANEIKHHSEELIQALKEKPEIHAWVVAKAERAATDLSDITHYLDGKKNDE